jgi:hypothetical protein
MEIKPIAKGKELMSEKALLSTILDRYESSYASKEAHGLFDNMKLFRKYWLGANESDDSKGPIVKPTL